MLKHDTEKPREHRTIPKHIQPFVVREHDSALLAFYKLSEGNMYGLLCVVDDQEKLIGILTLNEFRIPYSSALIEMDRSTTVGEVCSKNFRFLREEQDPYLYGTKLFADSMVNSALPIVREGGQLVGLFARWMAFFREFMDNDKLRYSHYAYCVWNAACLACSKGYKAISVMEFGVAGGTGLVLLEKYAVEVERLTGVKIEVYGFDSGSGLFAPSSVEKDLIHVFAEGEYRMDYQKLSERLIRAKLVIGDISETLPAFLESSEAAPIGAMMIDVDTYTPATAILNAFSAADKHFLPIVYLYFDDIHPEYQFQGEWQAVSEFNQRQDDMKITPEDIVVNPRRLHQGTSFWWHSHVKYLLRFRHKAFKKGPEPWRKLPLSV